MTLSNFFDLPTSFGLARMTFNWIVLTTDEPTKGHRSKLLPEEAIKAGKVVSAIWRRRFVTAPFKMPADDGRVYCRLKRLWFPTEHVLHVAAALGADRYAISESKTGPMLVLIGPRGRGAVMAMSSWWVSFHGAKAIREATRAI